MEKLAPDRIGKVRGAASNSYTDGNADSYANSDTNHCGWIDLAYPLDESRSGS